MVGEVFAAYTGFKSMLETARSLKDINDAVIRNETAIALQGQILDAQAAQQALVERVRELEAENASFKKWEAEKQRYELKDLTYGAFAYMLKREARGAEPAHWVCANCFEHGHRSIIQNTVVKGQGHRWICPSCHNTISPGADPAWLD